MGNVAVVMMGAAGVTLAVAAARAGKAHRIRWLPSAAEMGVDSRGRAWLEWLSTLPIILSAGLSEGNTNTVVCDTVVLRGFFLWGRARAGVRPLLTRPLAGQIRSAIPSAAPPQMAQFEPYSQRAVDISIVASRFTDVGIFLLVGAIGHVLRSGFEHSLPVSFAG